METLHDLPMNYDEAGQALCDWMTMHYDRDTIRAIAEHGCGAGCAPGLIYYSDCVDFYNDFTEEIWEVVYYVANEFGITPVELLIEYQSQDRAKIESHSQLCCAFSWIAVEHLAQLLSAEWELCED
jgi:hypothetical protein